MWALNLPPWVRYRQGLVHLALLLPKGIKNQAMLEPLLSELKSVGPGTAGVDVYDGHTDAMLTIFYGLVNGCHDLRALPHYVRHWQTPALIGACLWCDVEGAKVSKGATAYHEAIRSLPMGDPLRARHMALFEESEDDICKRAHDRAAPARNTREKAFAAMRLAEMETTETKTAVSLRLCGLHPPTHSPTFCPIIPQKHGYKEMDLISLWLEYYDLVRHNTYCTAHGLSNIIKDLFRLMAGGKSKKAFTKRRRAEEFRIHKERYPSFFMNKPGAKRRKKKGSSETYIPQVLKFRLTQKQQDRIDEIVDGLRLWTGLEKPPAPFSYIAQYKCHNSIVMASGTSHCYPLGATTAYPPSAHLHSLTRTGLGMYIVLQLDLDPEWKDLFNTTFICLSGMTRKFYTVRSASGVWLKFLRLQIDSLHTHNPGWHAEHARWQAEEVPRVG